MSKQLVKNTLLRKNTYSDTNFYDISNLKTREEYFKKQKFKEHFSENKNNILTKEKVINKEQLSGIFDKQSEYFPSVDNSLFIKQTQEEDLRYLHIKESILEVSSEYRNKTLYPNSNKYVVDNINLSGVISAEIISSTITNTLLLIKSTPIGLGNNKIYWQNQSDIYNSEPYTYIATIPDGNYTSDTLENIITEQMNAVLRINNSLNHDILVTINQTTDTTTFQSFESTTLSNPFTSAIPVSSSYTDIEVEYPGWTSILNVGDTIFISNSTSIGEISAVLVNTDHIIREKISNNIFIIRINTGITTLFSGEGGTSVILKRRINWKLLWGSQSETIGSILGFPLIDTTYNVIHVNSQETYRIFDISNNGVRIKINHIENSNISPDLSLVHTTTEHNLNNGDIIFINYDNTDGLVYTHFKDEVTLSPTEEEDIQIFLSELYNPEGLYVSNVTEDTFTVGVSYVSITSIENYIDANVIDSDENGDIILKSFNTSIKLSGENMIYLCCPELGRLVESDNDYITNNTELELKNIFCPFQLIGGGLSTNFNTFIQYKKTFNKNVIDIKKLSFSFRTKNGNLVDFNETDHNFIIKFNIVTQKFKNQDYSSKNNFHT